MARIIWVFYVSKIVEFNDTVRLACIGRAQPAIGLYGNNGRCCPFVLHGTRSS